MQLRVLAALGVFAVSAGMLAACTSAGSPPPSSTTATRTVTRSPSPSSVVAPTPVAQGSVRSAAGRCPFVSKHDVHYTAGMRLGRVTVQQASGHAVGCRFYALQGGPLHRSEHLPGPHQPALEITTARYPSVKDAHNAFVLLADKGTNPTQSVFGGTVGVCFQNHFDPSDHGRDWACTVNKGVLELVVQSVANIGPKVNNTGPLNTINITKKVFAAL